MHNYILIAVKKGLVLAVGGPFLLRPFAGLTGMLRFERKEWP
jgi:hypothetical protein